MENKETIINDVDVSECEYCLKMIKHRCTIQQDVYKCLCEENPNCHYKQRKRKEQECEKLRFPMPDTNYAILTKEEFEQLDKLKAENNELKKIIDEAKNSNLDLKSFLVGEAIRNEYEQQLNQLKAEHDKYEQALIEIKPILEFYANSNMGEEQSNGTYKIWSNGICITIYDPKPARQALQKISECDVEEQ